MIYKPTIMDAIKDSEIVMNEAYKNWSGYFRQYSPFYHITTEAVSTYIPAIGDNFTTALTIGSSAIKELH